MGRTTVEYNRRWRAENPEKVRAQRDRHKVTQRKVYKERRQQVVDAYGGACSCPQCPESNTAFLTFDHVNGLGPEHRWSNGRAIRGIGLINQLWRLLPERDPQIVLLCFNCNSGREINGGICPHQEVMPCGS